MSIGNASNSAKSKKNRVQFHLMVDWLVGWLNRSSRSFEEKESKVGLFMQFGIGGNIERLHEKSENDSIFRTNSLLCSSPLNNLS